MDGALSRDRLHITEQLVRQCLDGELVQVVGGLGVLCGLHDHRRSLLHQTFYADARESADDEICTVPRKSQISKLGTSSRSEEKTAITCQLGKSRPSR